MGKGRDHNRVVMLGDRNPEEGETLAMVGLWAR